MRRRRDPITVELIAAIGAGRITIRPIHCDDQLIHGCMEKGTGNITINPALDVVDTALHEALHRLRPKWSEQTVRQRIGKIMGQLSEDEIDRIYTVVLSVAKVRRRKKRIA